MARNTIASDTFDSSIGASWTNGPADWQVMAWVSGGVIEGNAFNNDCSLVRNTGTYPRAQWSTVTTVANGAGTSGSWAATVLQQDTGADESCYIGYLSYGAGAPDRYAIYEVDSTFGFSSLGVTGTSSSSMTSSLLTLESDGSGGLKLYTDEGSGDTLRLSASDGTLTSGRPGIAVWSNVDVTQTRITAWSGGDFGSSGITADASITLAAVTSSAAATLAIAADASPTLGALTSSAAATLAIAADASITLGALTSSTAATLAIAADASITLAALTSTSDATLAIAADASVTLGAVTLSSDGSLAIKADLGVTLGDVTLAATGSLGGISADAAIQLADATLASGATLAIAADASPTLAALTSSADASLAIKADLGVTLDAVTLSATGSLGGISADAAIQLADLTGASTATLAIAGAAAVTLGDVTSSAAGSVAIVASAAIQLGDVGLSASVDTGNPAPQPVVASGGAWPINQARRGRNNQVRGMGRSGPTGVLAPDGPPARVAYVDVELDGCTLEATLVKGPTPEEKRRLALAQIALH